MFSTIYLQDGDGSSSFPYYSLLDFSDAFFSVVDNTENLDETLLQYSDISNTTFQLEVYYTQIDESNRNKMVVEGDSSNFENELERVLGISSADVSTFKAFLQSVENMQLTIDGIKTFISRTSSGQL